MLFMYTHDLLDRDPCMMMRSRTRSTQINQACAQTTWAPSLSSGPLAFCECRSLSSGLQQLRVICALDKEVRVCGLSGLWSHSPKIRAVWQDPWPIRMPWNHAWQRSVSSVILYKNKERLKKHISEAGIIFLASVFLEVRKTNTNSQANNY